MSRRYPDPSKQVRNTFIRAEQESRASLPGCPKCDGSAIREGIAQWEAFREAAPDEHWTITEAIVTGQVTEDDEFDAMVAAAVRDMAAKAKPGSAAFAGLAARLETPGTPRPASYVAPAAGAAPMTRMEDMSSQELQAATLGAFGGLARVTRRS